MASVLVGPEPNMTETHTPSLTGKVAVITGASKGLGKAIAHALGRAGARLALIARDPTALETVAAAVRADGVEAAIFPGDVSDEVQVTRIAEQVMARFAAVHILVNNAGINRRQPVTEFTLAEWRQVMDTNLTGDRKSVV